MPTIKYPEPLSADPELCYLWPEDLNQSASPGAGAIEIRLMIKILHYLKDLKLLELWYIPDYG